MLLAQETILRNGIVAFGHQKQTGKDTFVRFAIGALRDKVRGKRIVRRGFADKLYDACYSMYGWAGFKTRAYYAEHPNAKSELLATGYTVRDTLIAVGQKLREYDKDVWINANLRDSNFDLLFISDLRFPNEFLHVRALGGLLVNVIRPGLPAPTDEADTALCGWDNKWDITIVNDGCLDNLCRKAELFVEEHLLGEVSN